VLFSLWDGGEPADGDAWFPAIPMSDTCKRNCNDCSDEESTGTQCKAFIPATSGQSLRMRLKVVEQGANAVYQNRSFTGDVWEVSIADRSTGQVWSVGKQLVSGLNGGGVKDLSFFDEHIGCTLCDAFDVSESRAGPWILPNPLSSDSATSAASATSATGAAGATTDATADTYAALSGVASSYSCDDCTCKKHSVDPSTTLDSSGTSFTYSSGPSTPVTDDWEVTLVDCADPSTNCTFDGVLYD